MIKNYLLVAYRNLRRHRVFSFINIGGLAIGLAAFWLIMLYVANELSYDRFHEKAGRIYRVAQHASWNGGNFHLAVTPPPMAAALTTEYPEIEQVVRLDAEGGATIVYGDKRIQAGDMLFADKGFFNVFSYRFLQGDPANALAQPQSIVLTETLAKKIFGDASQALNKTVDLGNHVSARVTAVIADVPANAHFAFSGLRPMPAGYDGAWENSSVYTYLLLKPNASVEQLSKKLPQFFTKYIKPSTGDVDYRMELQPLTSIHLHSNLGYEIGPNGNMGYVTIFSLVAALILIIASINYMNLSSARSSLRTKEIGVRKVNGSRRWQLVLMFLTESVLLTFIASALAIALVNLVLPAFRAFTGKEINGWWLGVWPTLLALLAFSLLTGCLSGLYPALFLSGFKLIPSLKGQTGKQGGNLLFRQSLVVFQFVITIAMIGGSIVIWQQLQYVRTRDLGFNKDQVITFHLNREMRQQIPGIKQQLLQNPLVESVAAASNPIGNNNIGGTDYKYEINGSISDRSKIANQFTVDEDFIPALQIKLIAGRNFMESMPADKQQMVIVNETLVKDAGWKDPAGKRIQMGKDSLGQPRMFQVAGVVKDFNIYSLQHKIEPLILQLPAATADKDNLYVRISKKNIAAALAHVQKVYKQYDPSNPFEYSFLDQNFAKRYDAEKMQGKLLLIFTVLAILIACLGLFGLVTFTAEQRRKEIGIRKVLGSSIAGIVFLLAKDLLQLVLIAFVIATPIAWLAMNRWLQDFAYRTSLHWWVFVVAGALAVLIAVLTVSAKAIRAAAANPVKSLRTE
ncbi:MAG TPA: ABC transporter permease [Chitinophagaceae bacterium]|nr:ABC transporter permease [Chitinophagaceae bacterium]